MVTLRQLQYFTALAELRHFGKAADRCCVTQPALSMQIKELEDTLDVQLVRRKRGHIELTAEGTEIAERAAALLSSARDLENYARNRGKTLVGELRLGVIPSVAPYLLPKILARIQKRYPGLKLKVHEATGRPLVNELIDGSLDAVILTLPLSEEGIESMTLFEDAFLLARRRTAARRSEKQVTAESLRNEKILLLDDGDCLRDQAIEYCSSLEPGALAEFGASSLSTIMKMVATGYGATLLPEIAAETELADPRVELLRFADPEPKRIVGLAWRGSSTRKNDFAELGRLIKEMMQPTRSREGADDESEVDCIAS